MATLWRQRTVWTGVAGAPYYSTFITEDPGADSQREDMADFWNALGGLIDNNVTWTVEGTSYEFDEVSGEVVSIENVTDDISGMGTAGGQALPRATQALVQWRTGVYIAGRELRGRLFLPCFVEDASNDGVLDGTAKSAIEDALDILLGIDLGTQGFNGSLSVWSRTHGTHETVQSFSVSDQFAVLRSRRD